MLLIKVTGKNKKERKSQIKELGIEGTVLEEKNKTSLVVVNKKEPKEDDNIELSFNVSFNSKNKVIMRLVKELAELIRR